MTNSTKMNMPLHARRRSVLNKIKKDRFFYYLIIPGILFFIIWHYIPLFGIMIAFKDVNPFDSVGQILSANWVGLKHFKAFFNNYYFKNVMGNTIIISFGKVLFGFPAPIILALLLNEIRNLRFKKTVQTISYLPHFISMVVLASLLTKILSTNGGMINEIIKLFGKEPILFLGNLKYFRPVLIISDVWQNIGWGSIIYLAAMTGIDTSLYEAAMIDGANRWKQTIHITIPCISDIIIIQLILRVSHILNAGFEQVLLLYSPGVYEVGDIIDTYVYREGVLNMKYSYSSAIGLFKSAIGCMMVIGTNFIAKRMGKEGIW